MKEKALAIGIGIIDNQLIDEVNIYEATKLAMLEAIKQLEGQLTQPDYLLIDAMTWILPFHNSLLLKAMPIPCLLQQHQL